MLLTWGNKAKHCHVLPLCNPKAVGGQVGRAREGEEVAASTGQVRPKRAKAWTALTVTKFKPNPKKQTEKSQTPTNAAFTLSYSNGHRSCGGIAGTMARLGSSRWNPAYRLLKPASWRSGPWTKAAEGGDPAAEKRAQKYAAKHAQSASSGLVNDAFKLFLTMSAPRQAARSEIDEAGNSAAVGVETRSDQTRRMGEDWRGRS